MKAYSWWDYLKFAQMPYAVYADAEIMANAKWLASLPADQRELLLAVGREISKEATEQTYKGNAEALKELEKQGGKITTLQGKVLEEFKAAGPGEDRAGARQDDVAGDLRRGQALRRPELSCARIRLVLEAYKKLNDGLEWLIVGFSGLLILVIVALPFVSAVVRYFTGEGYTWLAETPPQLVPWVVFPLLGVVLRHDGHIAVDVMPHYLKGRALALLRAAVLAACLAAGIAFAVFGARTVLFFRAARPDVHHRDRVSPVGALHLVSTGVPARRQLRPGIAAARARRETRRAILRRRPTDQWSSASHCSRWR